MREVGEKMNNYNNYGEDVNSDGDSTESNYDNYWGERECGVETNEGDCE